MTLIPVFLSFPPFLDAQKMVSILMVCLIFGALEISNKFRSHTYSYDFILLENVLAEL